MTIDATVPTIPADASCEIHQVHHPPYFAVELHHIIPVAWQLFWQPTTAPYPGVDPDGRGHLWDARTVPLCPTSHRAVHGLIVALMHNAPVPGRQWKAERGIAAEALARFTDVGGSLDALRAAREYGWA